MIITAMYLYGIISGTWTLNWWYGLLALGMDMLIRGGNLITVNIKK